MGRRSRGWICPRPTCAAFLDAVPFATPLTPERPLSRRPGVHVPADPAGAEDRRPQDVHPGRLRRDPRRDRPRPGRVAELAAPHRHHQPGRHRLHQSRALGEPPRRVRPPYPRRRVPRRQTRFAPNAGAWRPRASTSNSASPRRTCSCCWALPASRGPARRAAAPDRHGLRSVHQPRPRCAQLRLLPGRAVPAGLDAVRPDAGARRAASTNRSTRR